MRKILGPKSKYDNSLPFAYYAKVSEVEGDNHFLEHYFAETICGLIRCLDDHHISPDTARLFAAYTHCDDVQINTNDCLNAGQKWLTEQETCIRFETIYKKKHTKGYKGCVENGNCSFQDRDRYAGGGPY
jgi:hypothetical protein